jgi:hypothetical protein
MRCFQTKDRIKRIIKVLNQKKELRTLCCFILPIDNQSGVLKGRGPVVPKNTFLKKTLIYKLIKWAKIQKRYT